MVNQNYILYVNEKRNLRTSPIQILTPDINNVALKVIIPEKHLICGLVLKGKVIKGDLLRFFDISPVEKYLFEFSNIHFQLLENEYNEANKEYNFTSGMLNNFDGYFTPSDHIAYYFEILNIVLTGDENDPINVFYKTNISGEFWLQHFRSISYASSDYEMVLITGSSGFLEETTGMFTTSDLYGGLLTTFSIPDYNIFNKQYYL